MHPANAASSAIAVNHGATTIKLGDLRWGLRNSKLPAMGMNHWRCSVAWVEGRALHVVIGAALRVEREPGRKEHLGGRACAKSPRNRCPLILSLSKDAHGD